MRNENLNLGLAALLLVVAALNGGCDSVIPLGDEEEATMACLFDIDEDGFGAYVGAGTDGRPLDLSQYDPVTREDCAGRVGRGEPLAWLPTSPLDPNDNDGCIVPSYDGWPVNVCPDGDDDAGDDDDASDDDDTTPTGDDDDDDDDDSTPDVPPVDNGEEDGWVCWDPRQTAAGENSVTLSDAVVGEIYSFGDPTGWFDGNGLPITVDGSRSCVRLQCGWEHLMNGTVNGSEIGSPNQQYIVHDPPNSQGDVDPRQWGRWESWGGSQLSQDLQDNYPYGGGDVWVDPGC